MLRELLIKNFAIIDSERINFGSGFIALTGETGAGKSIVIGALSQLMGIKAVTSLVRTGDRQAVIEAIFDITGDSEVIQLLEEIGIEPPTDNHVILRREIMIKGRSRCFINDVSITATTMSGLLGELVSIHGQHQQHLLLDPKNHCVILDRFGGLWFEREQLAALHHQLTTVLHEIAKIRREARDKAQRQDLISFQIREIDEAALHPGEEEELHRERKILSSAHKLMEFLEKSYQNLFESDDSILSSISIIGRDIEDATQIDDRLQNILERFENAQYQLQDVSDELRTHRDSIEIDPERLDIVIHRLEEIDRLKKKYGDSITDILVYKETIEKERETGIHDETKLAELELQSQKLAEELKQKAGELSDKRKKASINLTKQLTKELNGLGMQAVQFEVSIKQTIKRDFPISLPLTMGPEGFEEIEFMISPNVGEDLKPLAQTASGGELSRIMLALRVLIANLDKIDTLIFDEVDVGIGGHIAKTVGQKIQEIAEDRQVICITHLPQIASLADQHLQVMKEVKHGRTFSRIKNLNKQERIEEIARMLDGETFSELSKDHAAHLLLTNDER